MIRRRKCLQITCTENVRQITVPIVGLKSVKIALRDQSHHVATVLLSTAIETCESLPNPSQVWRFLQNYKSVNLLSVTGKIAEQQPSNEENIH